MIKNHTANSEIIVGSYLVELLDRNDEAVAKGEVSAIQKFLPEQKFVFTGDLELVDESVDALSMLGFAERIDKCKFLESGKITSVFLIESTLGKNFSASFILSSSPITFGEDKKIHSIAFNLVNFNEEVREQEIEFSKWHLRLEQIVTKNNYDELKKTGGFLITHIGVLQKKDKSEFSIEECKSVLNFLYFLFSFCKGVSTPTFLTEGQNSNGEVVWYEIGSKSLNTWKRCSNWFTDSRIDLNEFASGFYDFCYSTNFKDHIAEIIYWYNTIHSSVNNYSAVIISHTALELISWIFLTE
ncbi:MAG: hypothetical protein WDZ80_03010, partial [Candidatus Paceibacterota bacterium]